MTYPQVDPTSRLVLVLKDDETKLYGNTAGFRSLARWMEWLATSDPAEFYELHLRWHFNSAESKSRGIPDAVWVLDERSVGAREKSKFEDLSLSAAPDHVLDDYQARAEEQRLRE